MMSCGLRLPFADNAATEVAIKATERKETLQRCCVKRTIEAMQKGLGRAVVDLRARMRWGQQDLANEITKTAAKMRVDIAPNRVCVSRWENGDAAPSSEHRMVLARVAAKHGHEDIAELFRAPVIAWRLVGRMRDEQ